MNFVQHRQHSSMSWMPCWQASNDRAVLFSSMTSWSSTCDVFGPFFRQSGPPDSTSSQREVLVRPVQSEVPRSCREQGRCLSSPRVDSRRSSVSSPLNKKAVSRFLRPCAYYRRLLWDFARIPSPPTHLMKDAMNKPGEEQQRADELKRRLQSPPSLCHSDQSAEVHTDASIVGSGAVPVQWQEGTE